MIFRDKLWMVTSYARRYRISVPTSDRSGLVTLDTTNYEPGSVDWILCLAKSGDLCFGGIRHSPWRKVYDVCSRATYENYSLQWCHITSTRTKLLLTAGLLHLRTPSAKPSAKPSTLMIMHSECESETEKQAPELPSSNGPS